MKQWIPFLLTAALFISTPCMAHIPTTTQEASPTLAPMLQRVTPAVVNIMVDHKIFPSLQKPSHSVTVGSGVIFNAKKGLIITNAHVVHDAKVILVTLKDGRRFHATLIGKDDGFDIAILKIHASRLTHIPFGNSNTLKVGDFVAAIGSPFGLTQTVTSGVISALNRSEPKIEGYQSFIQTDAPINPGNSGGALVNLNGQLIGINTAIVTPLFGNIGIGFAIPSNMAHSVVTQLLKYGKVERGMLGVMAQNITPDLAHALGLKSKQGVLVTKVIPNSAADTAGVHVEDVIASVGPTPIQNSVQLRNLFAVIRPGTPMTLHLIRDHKTIILSLHVGNPKKLLQRKLPFIGGLRLRNFSELEADGQTLKGVLVTGVSELSDGALAGLLPGDVITRANAQEITTVQQLENLSEQHPKQLLLKVDRANTRVFLVIEPSDQPEAKHTKTG